MSLSAIKVEIVFVKNSGIVVAVAMNVVAATSWDMSRTVQILSIVGRKYLSQINAMTMKQ